jgi:hypothetical protein
MKHELDDGSVLLHPDGTNYNEDQRYGFYLGLHDHIQTQYKRDRKHVYPSVEDQLDMLWHSMDKNEIVKSEPFYSIIKSVKSTYPKPT